MSRAHSSLSGFTLLEIMIALAIIGTALTVILHTVNYHAGIMQNNINTTSMYQYAKEKMHDLESSTNNSKGKIKNTRFTFENEVIRSEDIVIIELRTTIYNGDKKVMLKQLVMEKNLL
jgi:prepilin-type N-terminal cleavage/methylation domain-containing protein